MPQRSSMLPNGVRRLFRLPHSRTRLLRDADEEMLSHLAMRVAELRVRGMNEQEAQAEALRRFGDTDEFRDFAARRAARNARRHGVIEWCTDWRQDIRFAGRQMMRAPSVALVVILTLALGIGANTAIFSVVHHLLLAPLPYPDGNRIVSLDVSPAADPDVNFGATAEWVRTWSARSHTLDEFAADRRGRYRLGDDVDQDAVSGASITPSFLRMLRVHPVLGRGFTLDDSRPGAQSVVMIGTELWQLRYGGAPDVVGKVINLNGVPRTIVGVAPREMNVPISDGMKPDIWIPLNLDSAGSGLEAFARLRPGMTADMASRELQSITKELPDTVRLNGMRIRARRAQDLIDVREKRAIEVLFIAVGGLLLIACANIANLLLMRAWTRQREFAVRRALGAGRLRLVRQLLTESLMLAVVGGGLGLLAARQGLRTIIALRPGRLSDLDGVHIDAAVLLWTVGVSLATGFLFGAGPAVLSGSQSMSDALRAGIRTAVGNRSARRLRSGMIVFELALSLIFLVAAGLLVRSFVALVRTPIGYDPNGLVAVAVRFAREPAPIDRAATERALIRSLGSIPGVSQVAIGGPFFQTNVRAGPFAIEGPAGPHVLDLQLAEMPFVAADYFRVARIPIIQGRAFNATDATQASRELVVNQELARRLWPDGRALGAKLRVDDGAGAVWLTVVGIAGDIHLTGLSGDLFTLQMYRPTSAATEFVKTVVVRIGGGAGALEPVLKRAVQSAGVGATLGSMRAAESILDERVFARARFALVLFGLFAATALALSAVGLYGIIAYAVSRRTREIGVRVALGAEPLGVARLILGDSLRLVIAGCCLGLVGAFAATRALESMLFHLSPTDPTAFGGAVVVLIVVALVASFVPLRRALRIDPMDALRAE